MTEHSLTASIVRAVTRVAIMAAVVGGLYAGAGTAAAEVYVDADHAVPGGEAVLTFRVPSKPDTRALTTRVSVDLPDVTSVTTEVKPGWTARLDRDPATGTVRTVTWSAAAGVGIEAGQSGLFRLVLTLPDALKLSFPVTQTYEDGAVVRWDQPPLPGADIEHPRPTLVLETRQPNPTDPTTPTPAAAIPPAAAGAPASSNATPDVARGLAVAALLVGAIATGIWLSARRRA